MRTCEYNGKTLVYEGDVAGRLVRPNHWVDTESGETFHIVLGPAEEQIADAEQSAAAKVLLPTHLVDGEMPVVENVGRDGVARYFAIEGDVKGKMVAVKGREVTPFPNVKTQAEAAATSAVPAVPVVN